MSWKRASSVALALFALLSLALAACAPAAPSPTADKPDAVADFYRGQTIRFIGGDAGGTAVSLILETASRHIGKYIPGNPTVAFELMPGGAGLVSGNYIYGAARPDGLTIAGASAGMVGAGVAQPAEVQYELDRLTWLGNLDQTTVVFWIRSDFPCQTLEELRDCPEQLRFAGLSPTSVGFGVAPALIQEAFDLNMRFIYGYSGGAATILAVEQREADGSGGSWQSLRVSRVMDWIDDGTVNVVLQVGARDETLTELGVPHADDLAPEDHRSLLQVVNTMIVVSRPMFAPPELPEDRTRVLRAALDQVMADPEFQADLERANHPPINPQSGDEVQQAFEDIFNQPDEVLAKIRQLLGQ